MECNKVLMSSSKVTTIKNQKEPEKNNDILVYELGTFGLFSLHGFLLTPHPPCNLPISLSARWPVTNCHLLCSQ